MADQTIAKPWSLIKDFKILVQGIIYVVTFIVIYNSVLDFNYSMLLGHPLLKDAKVSYDWGNDNIIIQGIDTIKIILITKKLGTPTKWLKVLICYDFHSRISNEEKNLMFVIEPWLFSIETIFVPTLVRLEQPISYVSSTSLINRYL